MPRGKRKADTPRPPEIPRPVQWFWREILPLLRARRHRTSKSARHLRNAGIEVLEAMRALLDETIAWLREQDRSPELKRIRVEE